jgi:hypothetical protein
MNLYGQDWLSWEEPLHMWPPWLGTGWLQVRVRCLTPLLHVTEQCPQVDQWLQPPLTAKIKQHNHYRPNLSEELGHSNKRVSIYHLLFHGYGGWAYLCIFRGSVYFVFAFRIMIMFDILLTSLFCTLQIPIAYKNWNIMQQDDIRIKYKFHSQLKQFQLKSLETLKNLQEIKSDIYIYTVQSNIS